jgi:hypothetical protein
MFTEGIMGNAMGERLSNSPVSQSLYRAKVTAKRPPEDLLHVSESNLV